MFIRVNQWLNLSSTQLIETVSSDARFDLTIDCSYCIIVCEVFREMSREILARRLFWLN